MGVFGEYCGNIDIPEENRRTFEKQMRTILGRGGMMELEEVSMFDRKIALLHPVSENETRNLHFYYNYFEDDFWESAVYNSEEAYLGSGKIGCYEFNDVMTAAYMLYAIHDSRMGYVYSDERVSDPGTYVGWINYLLGTEYTIEKYFDFWDVVENYAESKKYEYSLTPEELRKFVPYGYERLAGGTDYTDLYCIAVGAGKMEEHRIMGEIKEGTYPYDIAECWRKVKDALREDENKNFIFDIIQMKRHERELYIKDHKDENGIRSDLMKMSLYLPARVFVYVLSDVEKPEKVDYHEQNCHFWQLWKEIKAKVYTDEKMKQYCSDEVLEYRKTYRSRPCKKIRTTEFLYTEPFVLGRQPEEIKDLLQYYVSDDDRMYWWNGSDDVAISDETDAWLRELAEEHKALMKMDSDCEDSSFLKEFIRVLTEADEDYERIMPFGDMFYEFVENGSKKEYQAAMKLLEKLKNDNMEKGKVINMKRSSWELTNRKITFNEGRLKLKRYLSVMANKLLREKYFGF